MARPKKKPDYNKESIQNVFIRTVTEAYLNPPKGMGDSNGRMCMKLLADEFQMTPIKIRKILVTAGVYETDISRQVNELHKSGKSVAEICKIMNLSTASVNGYLPYMKAIYSMEERSLLAERLEKYRIRKEVTGKLRYSVKNDKQEEQKVCLKDTVAAFAGYRFRTEQGTRFDYIINEGRILLSDEESYSEDELLEMMIMGRKSQNDRIEAIIKRMLLLSF